MLAILVLAAILRFVNLPARGEWGSDQGDQLLDVWRALQTGQLPQVGPLSSIGTFHHGALTYDLWLVPQWLGGGDPIWVLGQTALLGVLTVAMIWWVARSIGGSVAGLIAAYLAAISTALIGYSIFVWNPTLLEPGAALAMLGTWQAWRTRNPRWWLVAAFGLDVAMQSHISGPFLAVPLIAIYVLLLRRVRADGSLLRRHALWGAAALALIVVTYLPYVGYEIGGGFKETRSVVAYLATPSGGNRVFPPLAVLIALTRILGWPATGWPLIAMGPGFVPALLVAGGVTAIFIWQLAVHRRRRLAGEETDGSSTQRRDGFLFVGGSLAVLIVLGGLALKDVSLVQRLPTEQYHAWADPLALVALGLALGAVSGLAPLQRAPGLPQAVVVATLACLTVWNAGHWPPLSAPDGGYPVARTAARQLEAELGGSPVAIVSLFPPESTDGFLYPLTLDGVETVDVGRASVLVLYCNAFFTDGCQGMAEAAWLAQNVAGPAPVALDRIGAGPGRTLSVYRLAGP